MPSHKAANLISSYLKENGGVESITRLWTGGLVARSLGLPEDKSQWKLEEGSELVFSDHYSFTDASGLGEGAFGVCGLGVHKATGTRCAIKRIVPSSDYIAQFVQQDVYGVLLELTHRARHPNVVDFLDFLKGPCLLYAVMEPLEGPELVEYLERSFPTSEDVRREVMWQVLSALQHIHHLGIIHRDIKLENIRLRSSPKPDGKVGDFVLLDFGLCCLQGQRRKNVVGSLPYLAPDVFTGGYTTQVDVWAAGIILFIMLTGCFPIPDDTVLSGSKRLYRDALKDAYRSDEIKSAGGKKKDVNLMKKLLTVSAYLRPTADDALDDPWFTKGKGSAAEQGSNRAVVKGHTANRATPEEVAAKAVMERRFAASQSHYSKWEDLLSQRFPCLAGLCELGLIGWCNEMLAGVFESDEPAIGAL